ncbi:MAG TPA: M20/M25/M40 family metallo-hydrolase [Pyrinomonadaceae bacterium]|jgi:Zn-dependent M28 family amino/carboxypeptidase
MKKRLFSFLILLSFVLSVSAQKAKVAKPDLTEQNLRKHVAYLAADKLEGRRTGEQGATFAAGYVANMFAQYKLKAGFRAANGKMNFLQPFPYSPRNAKGEILADAKSVEAYNIVGFVEGTDAVLKNEIIVVGAHYDHLGKGGAGSLAANSTEIHRGADDNASGVATLLELARQFAGEKKNKRTIVFAAFGGEEEGLLGSKFYINNPSFPLDKTVAMINLDMVGRLNENKLTVGGIGTASEWKGLVENTNLHNSIAFFPKTIGAENQKIKSEIDKALKEKGHIGVIIEVKDDETTLRGVVAQGKMPEVESTALQIGKKSTINYLREDASGIADYARIAATVPFNLQLSEDGFGPSDHSSFYSKQIPVLFFFTGAHADYHKPTDTAEKINYEGLLKITHYVSEIVETIDQNPKRPTYAVAKSSGTGGRTGFNVTIGVVPSYAESTGGLLLDGVRDGSPAAAAGIKAGDKIVKFAGKEIRNISDYTSVLGELKADTEYEIEVVRGTERVTLKVKPAARK